MEIIQQMLCFYSTLGRKYCCFIFGIHLYSAENTTHTPVLKELHEYINNK